MTSAYSLLVNGADAGAVAAVDVVIEARSRVVTGDGLGAGSVGEELLEQVEGTANTAGVGKGAEVARAVLVHAPRDIDLREVL